jgi:plasmid stabilization system protein ParE
MNWEPSIRPEAIDELREIFDEIEKQKPGKGDEFLNSFESSLEVICSNPLIFPLRPTGARRKGLGPFPYSLFFLAERGYVVVLGVFHNRSNFAWIEKRLLP